MKKQSWLIAASVLAGLIVVVPVTSADESATFSEQVTASSQSASTSDRVQTTSSSESSSSEQVTAKQDASVSSVSATATTTVSSQPAVTTPTKVAPVKNDVVVAGVYYLNDKPAAGTYRGVVYGTDGKPFNGTQKNLMYVAGIVANKQLVNGKYYVGGKLSQGVYAGKQYDEHGALVDGSYFNSFYYENGVKLTGKSRDGYYFKNGASFYGDMNGRHYEMGTLFTGNLNGVIYKDGLKFTGNRGGVYYKAGKPFSGMMSNALYHNGRRYMVYHTAKFQNATALFKDGRLFTGTRDGVYYKSGKAFSGVLNNKLYKAGRKYAGYHFATVNYASKLFRNGSLYTGTYHKSTYEAGQKLTLVSRKAFPVKNTVLTNAAGKRIGTLQAGTSVIIYSGSQRGMLVTTTAGKRLGYAEDGYTGLKTVGDFGPNVVSTFYYPEAPVHDLYLMAVDDRSVQFDVIKNLKTQQKTQVAIAAMHGKYGIDTIKIKAGQKSINWHAKYQTNQNGRWPVTGGTILTERTAAPIKYHGKIYFKTTVIFQTSDEHYKITKTKLVTGYVPLSYLSTGFKGGAFGYYYLGGK
ncbi:hypothetical protein PKU16_04375 [Weissella cibaria]|uniref:hypothetical protein n=2 Tax=Weissella cibaria TaxID=137591 RepID=UPI0007056897|nr:hypothetical protein [Weissella cibaria]ALI33624.1 hypothetical protein AO080_09290 [Weissella cibaria]WCE25827.1 hypothetical protein PKU16_04375 [Weissella cibaria]WCE28015.1 hypothetical protein PKU15_04375 [Weissella cibaria]HCU09580.1 hypothetical protein [Weissella cibaria]